MKTTHLLRGMQLAWLFSIFLLLPGLAAGQVKLTGIVRDGKTGQTLPGTHVVMENTFLTTITDAHGSFSFPNLKKASYTVRFSFMGFDPLVMELRLTADTALDIRLKEAAILGEEVNITATRAGDKYPTAFTTITGKEISKVNLGRDLPYLMQGTPSLVTTSDAGAGVGYTGMTIRGTDLTRINVTVNGIPLNDPESQGVWFVDLPDIASSTRDIQVQRGVGTSTNGAGAFGATINIQTTQLDQEPYGEGSISAGSFGTFKGSVKFGSGLFGKNFAVDGRASWITSQGYIDRASSNLKSFYIAGGYYGKSTTLKLITFSGFEKTYQAWEGVPKDSLATNRTFNPAGLYYDSAGQIQYYKNQTDNYIQNHYQAVFSQRLADNWNINAALFLITGEGYYENYKQGQSFADYGLQDVIIGGDTITETDLVNRKYLKNYFYGFTFSSNYHVDDRLKLTLGGAYNLYNGDHYGKITWAQYASNSTNEWNWYDNTGVKKDFNIFVKATWAVVPKVNLFADMQYRYVNYDITGTNDNLTNIDQRHLFNFFNPKAGVYYDITDRQHAFFSVGIGNREPSRNNYVDAVPGQEPTSERLYDYELGYQYNSKKIQVDANLFYMNYHNQLVLTGQINNVGEAIMVNVPHSYRTGVEVSGTWKILDNLQWSVNAAFSSNKIRDFTQYIDVYDADWNYLGQDSIYLGKTDLSFSPDYVIGNTFTYTPFRKFDISLYSKYVGRQYIDNTSSRERSLDPYFVNNLLLSYSIRTVFFREIGFTLMINNIFNRLYESNAWVYPYIMGTQVYEENGYFPQAGINFMVGLTLKL